MSSSISQESFKAKKEEVLRECDDEAAIARELLDYVHDRQRRLDYEVKLTGLIRTLMNSKTEKALDSARSAIIALRTELYENSRVRQVTVACKFCGKDLVSVVQRWDGTKWEPRPVVDAHEHTCLTAPRQELPPDRVEVTVVVPLATGSTEA